MRFLVTIATIIFMLGSASADEVVGKLAIGDVMPESLGTGLDGQKIIASEHRGKIMVISFWATWCPPCRKELPVIDNLQRLVGKEKISVIAVNFGEKRRTYKRFVNAVGDFNLTFSHDNKARIGRNTYGIEGIPHMVIVDHEGNIAHVHSGYGDETVNNLANEINTLLRKMASG